MALPFELTETLSKAKRGELVSFTAQQLDGTTVTISLDARLDRETGEVEWRALEGSGTKHEKESGDVNEEYIKGHLRTKRWMFSMRAPRQP